MNKARKSILCQRCGKHAGTEIWATGMMEYTHGMYECWCSCCVAKVQLAYAQTMVAELKAREDNYNRLKKVCK